MKNSLLLGGLILVLSGASGVAAGAGEKSAPAAPAKADVLTGKVAETMNAATYTYVLVDTGGQKVWAAAPQFAVKVGDTVAVADPMPMTNYHSKTLDRTFPVVFFSGEVKVNGKSSAPAGMATLTPATGELPKGHPPTAGASGPVAPDLSGIMRADKGQTVVELATGKAKFGGKPIAVRGRVVKFNGGILGKNWLHIRDGSGTDGTNDLTVTTAATAKVGDLILVTGVLATDRDFGSGYKFNVIVEDATVVAQ